MKTIVVLVDFSDATTHVLEQCRLYAQALSAKVILMHVVNQEPVVVDLGLASPTILQTPRPQVVEADYSQLLQLRELLLAGLDVTVQQIVDGNMETVLQQTEERQADLIIVGSHHHSTLYELFVGTFTNDVLKSAKCPVLVVPVAREKK